jgi:hypothetical protein
LFQEVLVFITPHILKMQVAGESGETGAPPAPAKQSPLPENPANSGETPGK